MSSDWAQNGGMDAVIYQCPIMGKKVQAWFSGQGATRTTTHACPSHVRPAPEFILYPTLRALGNNRPL